ncbi:MAG: immunoglobulin domain-containing protein, partial [Verrucomicrobiota bacterium]
LGNGYATAWSKDWDNGAVADAGAVSLLNLTNLAGSVSASNSVLGMASGGGLSMNYSYDYVNSQLVVGQGPSSRVTLLGRASAPVTITNQPAPASQEVVMGGSVTFTVGGAGTGPFLYQWCVGRNTIVGATNASLTLTNLQVANSGGYWVRVSGPSGGAISDVASLRVLSPPSLAGGLTGFWKCEDGSDSSGYNHPLTPHSRYPTALDDQSYTFTDVYPSIGKWLSRSCANTYYYDEYANWATITNYPKTTNAMTIAFWLMTWNFISPAVIACDGDAVANSSFSIQTWWNSPASRYDLKFQYADGSCSFPTSTSAGGYWRHLAMTMDGATARVYTNGVLAANFAYSGPITNGSTALYFNGTGTNVTKSGSQVYYYSGGYDEIMMWDRALSTNEMQVVYGQGMMGNSAILIAAPAITAQPQDVNVNPGQTATFTVGVSGAPLAYQWLKNGTNLPGATANPLVLTNIVISDNGVYALRVTNYLGSVTSSNATLLAGNPPTFAAQPGSVLTLVGPARLLSATVAGDSPMSYQWRLNGADVAGAVANSLAFTGIQLSHAGNYALVATNLAGT